ncbi:hypothetical protein JHL17_07365 [Azospirillum sp. YIM B02556]|uniref:Uncharacterized protein n=1 Tax=Azospirillum endophyticum TaxID=2800326 RepID=A0ABS1F1D1_9PROT|nr:hypothetical protein [Azospirillum endophyticum]MBK1837228.1 hypothetical protein [Azospirillum endophyticum]
MASSKIVAGDPPPLSYPATILALTIGKLFFPVQSAFGPLLLALLAFGTGFVVRPLGGALSG